MYQALIYEFPKFNLMSDKYENITLSGDQVRALCTQKPTMDVIRMLPQVPWDMKAITQSATIGDIEKYPKINWHLESIESRVDVTPKIMRRYPHLKYKMTEITEAHTLLNIAENLSIPWDKTIVKSLDLGEFCSLNLCSKPERVKKLLARFGPLSIGEIEEFVENVGITSIIEHLNGIVTIDPYDAVCWDNDYDEDDEDDEEEEYGFALVKDHPYFSWDLKQLTKNLEWPEILNYSYITWDPRELLNKKDPPFVVMRLFPHVPFTYKDVTIGSSWNDIVENPAFPWDEEELVKKKDTPVSILRRLPELKWDMKKITKDEEWNVIRDNRDIPWCKSELVNVPEWFFLSAPTIEVISIRIQTQYGRIKWEALQQFKQIFVKDMAYITFEYL
jgi:hypothetical protein